MNEDLNRANDDDDMGYYERGDNVDRPLSARHDIGFSLAMDAELEHVYDLRARDRYLASTEFNEFDNLSHRKSRHENITVQMPFLEVIEKEDHEESSVVSICAIW